MQTDRLIFLVDDDEGFVDTTASFLRRKGFRVEVCRSVSEALGKIDQGKPDLAIVDLLLDNGDGTEVIKAIKERFPKTHTIVLSGQREDEVKDKISACGADQFIPKPLTTSQLQNILEKVFVQ